MSPRDVVYVGHMLDTALKAVGKGKAFRVTRMTQRTIFDSR